MEANIRSDCKGTAARPRRPLELIGSRNFGPYFVGNALSSSGTWFQNLAAGLLVYRLTHSAFLLGVLNFAQFAPALVLTSWAGAAADRIERRRLVATAQASSATLSALLAALAWRGHAPVSVVIGITFGIGIAAAFSNPASMAMVGSLVEPGELPSAVALNSVTYNLARAIGPALAGITVKTLGIPAAFAINSASYLLLVVGVLVVRPRPQALVARGASRLGDSFRLLRRKPELLVPLAIVAVVGFGSDPINTLSPAFARAFGRPDTDAGFVIGVFGAGAITAAFVLAGRIGRSRLRLAGALTLLGLGIALFSVLPGLPAALVLLFVGGFGYLAANTAVTTELQLRVDEIERGRVMALWTLAFIGLRPLASLADGGIASAFGVRVAGVALSVPALAAAGILVSRRSSRKMRASRSDSP